MAITQSEIDALELAIASGVRRVEYVSGDTRRVVEYRSQGEMERALQTMKDKLAGSSGGTRVSYVQHGRD